MNKVVDLTSPEKNVIYNMTHEEAVELIRSGDVEDYKPLDIQSATMNLNQKLTSQIKCICDTL